MFDDTKNVVPYFSLEDRLEMANERCEDLLRRAINAERDCLKLTLRLMGEDPHSFGIESAEAMDRWRPKAEALMNDGTFFSVEEFITN